MHVFIVYIKKKILNILLDFDLRDCNSNILRMTSLLIRRYPQSSPQLKIHVRDTSGFSFYFLYGAFHNDFPATPVHDLPLQQSWGCFLWSIWRDLQLLHKITGNFLFVQFSCLLSS